MSGRILHISELMMNVKKPLLILFSLLAILTLSSSVQGAETAMQAINRTVALLSRNKGIKVRFAMTSGGQKVSGELKAAGSRFAINSAGYSTWFDGKTMWVHNSKTNETTLSEPTAAEVGETNPLSLISANSNSFSASFLKNAPKGYRQIRLVPKKKGTGVKQLTVTIGRDYKPVKIVAVPTGGQTTVFDIRSLDTTSVCRPSDFVYPKAKYKKAEIIDLR